MAPRPTDRRLDKIRDLLLAAYDAGAAHELDALIAGLHDRTLLTSRRAAFDQLEHYDFEGALEDLTDFKAVK